MDENNNVVVRVGDQEFVRGEDGYSPVVTVEEIEHGHSVNITDREHPVDGQTFNVMDGATAYEQAVAGGYTGTEAQFNEELASFKELSDEAKEVAPFYAIYGQTTKAEIAAAINGKRQIYLDTFLGSGTVVPYVGPFSYDVGFDSGIGYRFVLTEGNLQYVYELRGEWTHDMFDLTAPAQRAEAAAATALTRMNSADQSAQNAAGSASNASRDAGTASAAATTATEKAGEASDSATAADGSAKDAEAYAIGKRGGTDVGSTDPAYHNNAKYYAEQAALIVDDVEQVMTPTTIGPTALATFDASVAGMPLKGLTVDIEPVQAEGTPSPENPLPISGWTGANVFDDPKYALKINWNQIRTDSAQDRTLDGITTAYDPQTHLCTITNNSRTTNFGSGSTQCVVSSVAPIPGHRYALLGESHAGVAVAAVNGTTLRPTASVGRILTMSATTPNTGFRLRITSSYDFVSAHPVGDVYSFHLNIIDITQLLGEEAAATATYDQIAEMFPNDWYPYNAGEITCVSAVNGDPYQKIAVNWEDEAGTVYGGTATYNGNGTWSIKSDWAYYSLTSLTRSSNHNFYKNAASFNRPPKPSLYTTDGLICDRLPTISNPGASAAVDGCYINASSAIIVRTKEAYSTAADAIAGLGGVVNFAYKTNAVREFVVSTDELISTFLGTNNILADCGDVTVTYGAYLETVKSYADQVGDSILSAIAPLETSYTASRAYTVGSFLFVGTKFYKVTAAISSGDTITPDTNVTQTTVAEQLMALANV